MKRSLQDIMFDIKSHDADIRRFAVRDLCVSDIPDKVRILEDFLVAETDIQIKYEIRKSINELQSLNRPVKKNLDSENLRNLDRAFQATDPEIVNRAYIYAVKHRLEEFLPEMLLIESYTQDTFHKVCNIRLLLVSGDKHFDHILGYLEDPEPRVISTAIEALEIIGNTQALASITQFSGHEHNRVRATAIKALHNLGDARSFAFFTRMVQSPHSAFRDSAAFALAQINLEQGPQLLAILLMDEVESVRVKALRGLEKLADEGNGRAREILENVEKQNPFGLWPDKIFHKFQGIKVEVPIKKEGPAALDSDIQEFRMSAVQSLVEQEDGTDPSIIINRLKLEKDYKVIAALVVSLGRIKGDPKVIVPVLEKYLSHHNDRVRANAVEAIACIVPPANRQILFRCLDDTSNRVVGNAILALYKVFRKKTDAALNRLADSPHKLNNLTAAFCIGELADHNLHILATKLLRNRHPEVREKTETILKILEKDIPAFRTTLENYKKEKEAFA